VVLGSTGTGICRSLFRHSTLQQQRGKNRVSKMGKGKIIAISALLIIAGVIVYYMVSSGTDSQSDTGNGDGEDSGSTPDSKYDFMLSSKVIEYGPWSKYAADAITDGPGIMKPGATRIWMNGAVYPIDVAIAGGIGAYTNKPKI
jgi:hypothetical protein